MAMAKKKLMNPSHVLIFVEGDTDEIIMHPSTAISCCLMMLVSILRANLQRKIE